ncbi:MAG: PEP-CTERM sorting domain-containing protein [Phycisphaerae bacterium]
MPVALEFTDGSAGLFVAAVPEPATLSLVAFGGVLALRRRRPRRPGRS